MSGGHGKLEEGILLTLDGSHTGKAHVLNKYTYNCFSQVEYCGEAPTGKKDNEFLWYIEKIVYNTVCEVSCILTACNQFTTKASAVSVDTTSNTPNIKITLTGGDLTLVNIGDTFHISTLLNNRTGLVTAILSATEVLISGSSFVDETSTPITDEEALFIINDSTLKKFQRRRWDKRELYIYA